MKIKTVFTAAIAAGAMTVASYAQETSSNDTGKTRRAEIAGETSDASQTFGDLMKRVLRAGNAAKAAGHTVDPIQVGSTQQVAAVPSASAKGGKAQAGSRPYHSIISRYAKEYGVPVSLAHAVISIESGYRETVRGQAGEIGLMQIKPTTARGMGYTGTVKALYRPENNVKYGMKYLAKAYELSGGDTCGTILRYNAGHGARRMNPVSSAYCKKVQRILASG